MWTDGLLQTPSYCSSLCQSALAVSLAEPSPRTGRTDGWTKELLASGRPGGTCRGLSWFLVDAGGTSPLGMPPCSRRVLLAYTRLAKHEPAWGSPGFLFGLPSETVTYKMKEALSFPKLLLVRMSFFFNSLLFLYNTQFCVCVCTWTAVCPWRWAESMPEVTLNS